MMESDASVRADIQKYEATLAKDSGSYCFAPLAELYRKLGLIDEAIAVAKLGCDLHPDYVGGQIALGRACLEKGLTGEGKDALEKVVSIAPDNMLALKLLSRMYVEQGNSTAAGRTLQLILSQSPDDIESKALLKSLEGVEWDEEPGGLFASSVAEIVKEENEVIIDDAEIIEELGDEDLFEAEFEFSLSDGKSSLDETDADIERRPSPKSPLSTITMAELYVSQGFIKRALTVYREMVDADPDNAALKKRLYELKTAIDADTAIAKYSSLAGTGPGLQLPASGNAEPANDAPAPILAEDTVLETLEKWLDTIKRRR